MLILHAHNLSKGFICNYAKGGKAIEDRKEEVDQDTIVEVPIDLPQTWMQKVNRDNREAEFHYVFADYQKDTHADYIIKMKA